MLKKLTLATVAAVLALNCMAADAGSFYAGPSVTLNNITTDNSSYRGLSPHFSVGYGDIIANNFYLAGEISGTPGSIDLTNNTHGAGTSVKTTHGYGASIIPGIMLNSSTTLYGRLGVVDTRFTDQNKNVFGGQAGIGLQTSLTPTWDLRGEYTYTGYRSISGIGSPNADAFGLGVIHKFD